MFESVANSVFNEFGRDAIYLDCAERVILQRDVEIYEENSIEREDMITIRSDFEYQVGDEIFIQQVKYKLGRLYADNGVTKQLSVSK